MSKKKMKPTMTSLEAAMINFSGPELPTAESMRGQILSCIAAVAKDEYDLDSESAAKMIDGLLDARVGAIQLELAERDEDTVFDTLSFTEAEQYFLKVWTDAYRAALDCSEAHVDAAGCGWPDYLPMKAVWTKDLIIDVGRMLGFHDAARAKAFSKFAEEESRKAMAGCAG